MLKNLQRTLLVTLAAAGSAAVFAAGPVKVQILSAVIKDKKIAGATVILQKNGAQSVTTTTNAAGDATLAPAFSEADEGVFE